MQRQIIISLIIGTLGFSIAGQGKEIDPIDQENLGTLLVKSPNWATEADRKQLFRTGLYFNGKSTTLDKKNRYQQQEGCLSLREAAGSRAKKCDVQIRKKLLTTVQLVGLKLSYNKTVANEQDKKDNHLYRDFGPVPQLHVKYENETYANFKQVGWRGRGQKFHLLFEGKYTFQFGIKSLPDLEYSFSAGQVYDYLLNPPDVRARLTVVPLSHKSFPNPVIKCVAEQRIFAIERSSTPKKGMHEPHTIDANSGRMKMSANLGVMSFKGIDQGEESLSFAFPLTPTSALHKYQLVVNNLPLELDLKAGDHKVVRLERIDVNDVFVEQEDGESYYAAGRYSILRRTPDHESWEPLNLMKANYTSCNGAMVLNRKTVFPTKSGVDVLPGLYKVVVTYNTREGSRTQEFELDLRIPQANSMSTLVEAIF